jgi:hypothetical protein
MAPQILVALRSQDRLSQMIPYLEEIAQPGMKLVFLIRFGLGARLMASQYDSSALWRLTDREFEGEQETPRFTCGNRGEAQSTEKRRLAVEHNVFRALEALLSKGIEMTVDVYTGSLRSVVKNYMREGNVHLIMKRAGRASAMMQVLKMTFSSFAFFKQPAISPIRLFRADQAVFN